jgi:hypothetical protein
MVPTDREIYELVLEVSRGVDRLEHSIDQLLADARALNREFSSDFDTLARLRDGLLKQTH